MTHLKLPENGCDRLCYDGNFHSLERLRKTCSADDIQRTHQSVYLKQDLYSEWKAHHSTESNSLTVFRLSCQTNDLDTSFTIRVGCELPEIEDPLGTFPPFRTKAEHMHVAWDDHLV